MSAFFTRVSYEDVFRSAGWYNEEASDEDDKPAREPVKLEAMQRSLLHQTAVSKWAPCDVGYEPDAETDGASCSCFGRGARPRPRKEDPKVRACERAEVVRDWVVLNNPPRKGCGPFETRVVVPLLQAAGISIRNLRTPLCNQELLRYTTGGHFVSHCDRVLGDFHLGTLLLIVPDEDIGGGELEVRAQEVVPVATYRAWVHTLPHDPVDVLPGREPLCVFIPLGTPHRVVPVTAGTRLVAKAAVFGVPIDPTIKEPAIMEFED